MTAKNAGFSVVICAYTEARWTDLLKAIGSVCHQTLPAAEIIVVIDHNSALLARLQEVKFEYAKVILVENSQARGLSGARNSGVANASGDIIVFLDDDAVAEPDWLYQLSLGFEDKQVMGVGGAIIPIWQNKKPEWFPEEFNWVVGCTYRGLPENDAPVRNVIGCNMAFRRSVFESVGGFRTGRVGVLSIGQENDETEFCIRLAHTIPEAKLLYRPVATVQHSVTATRSKMSYFVKRCYSEGLSKSRLGRTVGKSSSLASEQKYVRETLPKAVVQGLYDSVLLLQPTGLGRATAVMAGLAVTVAGYVVGTTEPWLGHSSKTAKN